MCHLRQKDILNPLDVQFAILETNGTLSVFPYAEHTPPTAKDAGVEVKAAHLPVTIIEDGVLLRENLSLSGKDDAWVASTLKQHDAKVEDTFLLALMGQQVLYVGMEGRS